MRRFRAFLGKYTSFPQEKAPELPALIASQRFCLPKVPASPSKLLALTLEDRFMGRPLRNRDPQIFRLITCRTDEARLWINPSRNLAKIIGGVVARYQERFKVEIYALVFLGNHYHMLIKAPLGNADEFMENVNREIARRINWQHGRQAKFWARRYDDQQVLSEDDVLEAFLYITTNMARHGLVEHPSQWTGLCSFEQSLTGMTRTYSFKHHSLEEQPHSRHLLTISPIPQVEGMSRDERKAFLLSQIDMRAKEIADERAAKGQGSFLGLAKLREIPPGARPAKISRSPRPSCYSKCSELIKAFREEYRLLQSLYAVASEQFRRGNMSTEFPAFCFHPPLHRGLSHCTEGSLLVAV